MTFAFFRRGRPVCLHPTVKVDGTGHAGHVCSRCGYPLDMEQIAALIRRVETASRK